MRLRSRHLGDWTRWPRGLSGRGQSWVSVGKSHSSAPYHQLSWVPTVSRLDTETRLLATVSGIRWGDPGGSSREFSSLRSSPGRGLHGTEEPWVLGLPVSVTECLRDFRSHSLSLALLFLARTGKPVCPPPRLSDKMQLDNKHLLNTDLGWVLGAQMTHTGPSPSGAR